MKGKLINTEHYLIINYLHKIEKKIIMDKKIKNNKKMYYNIRDNNNSKII